MAIDMSDLTSDCESKSAPTFKVGEAPGAEASPQQLRAAMDSAVLQGLQPLALGLSLLFTIFAVAHAIVLPPVARRPMVVVAALTAAVLLGLYFALQRWSFQPKYAHPIGVFVAILVLFNSLYHLYLLGDPLQATNVALVIIGAGCLALSARWLAVTLVVALGGWIFVDSIRSVTPDFRFLLLASATLSILIHTVRVRTLCQLEKMRIMDRSRQSRLEEALDGEAKARAELEVKVRDRTAELTQANAELKEKVTERERLLLREQHLRSEAETANRLKDEFLATLSHELRTPLTAILGWSRLLMYSDLDADKRAQALEAIGRNAKSQSQLIDDLLDVSRIITGKLRLDVRPVELAPVVEAAVLSIRPAADAKDIRLRIVLDPRAGLVSGDPNRLQQVVWNLLSNAVKFTSKGGQVLVRLQRIDSHVEVTVTDTGQGIDPEFLPHVFDRFRQADGSTTRQYGGLGLGLAIVRHLLELHGGTVEAESEGHGEGATFRVKLPLMAVNDTKRISESEAERRHSKNGGEELPGWPAPLDGLRVLAVDDEEDARELITALMERCGAEIRVVATADEALEVLESWRPDVLVSDIGMPGEDGYALIRKVRSLPAGRGGRTPAVALTAYARTEDRVRVLSSGYQVHVAKPVEPVELMAAVASLAGRSSEV